MKNKKRLVLAGSIVLITIFAIWHVAYASWMAVCPFGAGGDTTTAVTTTTWIGQSFKAPAPPLYTQLESAYFQVSRENVPSGDVIMELWRADSNGNPQGVPLRSVTRSASSLSNIAAPSTPQVNWNDGNQCNGSQPLPNSAYLWTLATPYTLAPSQDYVLTFRRTATGEIVHASKRANGTSSGVYEDGHAIISTNSGGSWADLLSGADETDIRFYIVGAGDGSVPPTPTPIAAEKQVIDFADSLGFNDAESQFLFGLLATALTVIVFLAMRAGFVVSACVGAIVFLAFVGLTFIPEELLITILLVGGIIVAVLVAQTIKGGRD